MVRALREQRPPKLVFAAAGSVMDPSSGAAVATADALECLARAAFRCQAFGLARLDFCEEVCVEQTLAELGLRYDVRTVAVGPTRARMLFTRKGNVPITLFRNQFTRAGPTPWEGRVFLAAFDTFLAASRPDVLITYGGDPLGCIMIELARQRVIPIVFALHNLSYRDPGTFRHVDYATVPSDFANRWYRENVGLSCDVLPNVIDPERVVAPQWRPQYLTFVNPQPMKGLYVFAGIAEQIARRRPDIPILVVDSRGRARALEQTGVDLSWARNLFGMRNTTDPRKFYAVTKVLIMPSVCCETFGLVAAEAMMNGIPVVASNRGALPETIGEGGIVLDIPARYTPASRVAPTADEVEPWVEAILRLWDDGEFYRVQSERARRESQRWHPDRLRPLYVDFFRNVRPQPGPPIVPKELWSQGAP